LNKVHIHLLALTLAIIGLGIFLYKILVFHFPLLPEAKARIWHLETKLTFVAKGEAIGAGIDLTTGTTLTAVSHQGMVSEHPDTGNPISGLAVPCWQTMLQTASRCYDLTHLGYLGVDLVLDRTKGPLLLELNARPGLGIQMANGVGLLPRLQMVERHCRDLSTVEDRVGFAYEKFKC
jgi:hypothetical protein